MQVGDRPTWKDPNHPLRHSLQATGEPGPARLTRSYFSVPMYHVHCYSTVLLVSLTSFLTSIVWQSQHGGRVLARPPCLTAVPQPAICAGVPTIIHWTKDGPGQRLGKVSQAQETSNWVAL